MSSKGITLIELIVALSIFALIVPLATSLLVSIMQNQRKLLTQQDILSQANYAVEYMSRAMRTALKGASLGCAGTSAYAYDNGDQSSIKFINHNNPAGDICQEFHLNNGNLEEVRTDAAGGGTATINNLLSSAYKVASFKVYISPDPSGTSASPKYQPRVTFYLDIQANTGEENPPEVKIQTTVSQRNLNI